MHKCGRNKSQNKIVNKSYISSSAHGSREISENGILAKLPSLEHNLHPSRLHLEVQN